MTAILDERKLEEYMAEMRATVCSRCIERPPGGPPCAPLGKVCGIELHLPEIVDAVHHVRSDWVADYLQNNREEICAHCCFHHSEFCPCPMDYLAALVVEAVEAVDERHSENEPEVIGFDTVI